jgi:hypothetical protein
VELAERDSRRRGRHFDETHYDQTDFGYDSTKQRKRTVSPGGTITFQVFDVHRHVIATYIGTDDSGASEADPFMQTHFLQQIQGGQQIGSIEIEMKCKTQYLASSAGLPESAGNPNACRVGGAKRGREHRPCASSGSTPTATWSGHGPPREQFFFADGCCLARAGLFTDPLTTPIMHETAKHSRKSKPMAAVKTYQGVVDNGIIRLDPEIRLPENLQVFVVVPETGDERPLQIRSPRLVHRNQLPDFAKEVREAEGDARV